MYRSHTHNVPFHIYLLLFPWNTVLKIKISNERYSHFICVYISADIKLSS